MRSRCFCKTRSERGAGQLAARNERTTKDLQKQIEQARPFQLNRSGLARTMNGWGCQPRTRLARLREKQSLSIQSPRPAGKSRRLTRRCRPCALTWRRECANSVRRRQSGSGILPLAVTKPQPRRPCRITRRLRVVGFGPRCSSVPMGRSPLVLERAGIGNFRLAHLRV